MLSKNKAEELMSEAQSDRYQGKYKEALEKFNALMKELDKSKERWARFKVGEILHQIGVIYQNMGEYESALNYIQCAITHRQKNSDYIGLAYSYFQFAMCRLASGEQIKSVMPDFAKADEAIDRAVYFIGQEEKKSKKKGENCKVVGDMYHNWGYISQVEGDFKNAIDYYEAALIFRKEARDQRGEGLSCARMAECNFELGNFAPAKTCSEKALKIFQEIGDIERIEQVEKTIEQIEKNKIENKMANKTIDQNKTEVK